MRRFLERLAIWGRIRKRAETSSFQHNVEVLTQTAANLARKRNGGLIVIMGEDHSTGTSKKGRNFRESWPQPLLESIFDPHSIGHDGAVIIDRDRVTKFGCHLPLSSNSRAFGNVGLRHTAALGLSERSDALCIVISEERGTISIARDKKLVVLENAAALKTILEDFYAEKSPRDNPRTWRSWLSENASEKWVAVTLACVLWIVFGYQRETVQRDVVVPIEYRNLPVEWVIEEPKMTDAKIILMGPEQAFHLFSPSSLKISLDLSQVKQGGQEVSIPKSLIRTPSNISVIGIKPERIHIMAYKLIAVRAPIEVRTTGGLSPDLSLHRIEVNPAFVTVLVPPRLSKSGIRLRTGLIDLREIRQSTTITPELLLPPEIRLPGDRVPQVSVTVKVRPRERSAS